MTWIAELGIDGQVLTDEVSRSAVASDFGGVITRLPACVVQPASAEDVARTVKFAAARGLAVSTRGAGHSQSGQSLSDAIVVGMTSLAGINRVDETAATDGESTVACGGGAKWRALVEQLAPLRLSPPVLTNNLDVTIGGTLSTAGLGVASWRRGTQADHCLELEVVTGEGEIVRCSEESNRELFDAALAGMGQFGVITRATLRLRRHAPRYRSHYLLYDDLGALLGDLETMMAEERFDYLESWCVPCPQGFRKVGTEKQVFAEWFYPLHATLETGAEKPGDPTVGLRGLRFYKHVHTDEGETSEFFTRLDPLFALWKRAGFWEYAHPWMECVLPWKATPFYITQVLGNLPPQALAGGHVLLWPARGGSSRVPLFMRPPGDYVMGFGLLPAFPKRFVQEALPRVNQASAASMMMGGKRYPSGWVDFDAAKWKAHYGNQWPTVVALKKKYDPKGILNPGFLKLE